MGKRKKAKIEELTISAWKGKINATHSNRALRATLLKLLDEKNLEKFNNERRKQLSEAHDQGFTWTPTLPWLWTIILFFLPTSMRPGQGSSLRQALVEIPTLEKDTTDYREDFLEEKNDFETGKKEDKSIDEIIEHLYDIKEELSLEEYQKLLSEFFHKYPIATLNFYFDHYNPNHMNPSDDMVIEHKLMSQALMDWFVLPCNPDGNLRIFAIQKLFMVMGIDKGSALKKLLQNANDKNLSPNLLFKELDNYYETAPYIKKDGQNKKDDKHKKPITARGVAEKINYDLELSNETNSSILLTNLFNNPKVFDCNIKQPLFSHLARQASQTLLNSFHQNPQEQGDWNPKHAGYDTVQFLSERILRTWGSWDDKKKFSISGCNAILNPMNHQDVLGNRYKYAVSYANSILVGAMLSFNDALNEARNVAKLQHNKKSKLEKDELLWILDSVEQVEKDGTLLAKAVNHILTETTFYNENDLARLPALDYQESQLLEKIEQANKARDQLHRLYQKEIKLIREEKNAIKENASDKVNEARRKLNELDREKLTAIQTEKETAKEAITILNYLLKNRNDSKQLETILQALKIVGPLYLTNDLYEKWKKEIYRQQQNVIPVAKEDIVELTEKDSDNLLKLVEDNCKKAERKNRDGHFVNEKNYAVKAASNFQLFLQNCAAVTSEPGAPYGIRNINSTHLQNALEVLNNHLNPLPTSLDQFNQTPPRSYVTKELAEQWKQEIYEQQKELIRFREDDMKTSNHPKVNRELLLETVETACKNAEQENKKGIFLQEHNFAGKAIYYYELYLKDPIPAQGIKAQAVLDKLAPYLTPEFHKSLGERLDKARKTIISSVPTDRIQNRPLLDKKESPTSENTDTKKEGTPTQNGYSHRKANF